MKYLLTSILFLSAGVVHAEEGQNELDLPAVYQVLEAEQKNLASSLVQVVADYHQIKEEVEGLVAIQGQLTAYKQTLTELKEANHQLAIKWESSEKENLQLRSLLGKITGSVENLQADLAKAEQREVQQKTKLQGFSARLENLSQQMDEVHRKVSKKR